MNKMSQNYPKILIELKVKKKHKKKQKQSKTKKTIHSPLLYIWPNSFWCLATIRKTVSGTLGHWKVSFLLKVVFLTAMWNRGLRSKNTLAWMEMLTVKDTTQIEYKYFQPPHFVFFLRCYIKRTQLFENMLQLAFYKVQCIVLDEVDPDKLSSTSFALIICPWLCYILQHSRLKLPEICSFQSQPLMPKSARTL